MGINTSPAQKKNKKGGEYKSFINHDTSVEFENERPGGSTAIVIR